MVAPLPGKLPAPAYTGLKRKSCAITYSCFIKNASVGRAANLGRSALVLFQLWDVIHEIVDVIGCILARIWAYEWHNGCGFIHREFQALMAKNLLIF